MDAPQIIFSSEKKKSLKLLSSEYFSANDFTLTEEELQKARIELFETEENKIRKLQELRDKLANDKEVNYRTDTEYLLRILRVRKYDSTKAYQNIKEGYLFKKKYPELFLRDYDSENLDQMLNQDIFRYLPYTDEQGHVLFHLDIEKWNHQEMHIKELSKTLISIADIISMNPRMQVNGGIGIWDTKGLTAQNMAAILRTFGLGEIVFIIQNMYPWRLKKILVLSTGHLTRLFYKMLRPFLSKKISSRVFLLGNDVKELHQHVNPVLLPKGLGGFLEEKQCSITQNIIDNISYIKYYNSFLLNE